MGKLNELSITVKPVITVDDSTAYTILGLLELYCRANEKTIDVSHSIDYGERVIILNLVEDKS